MISPAEFCTFLAHKGLTQYYGVPDSLLKSLCAYIDNHYEKKQHIITANEGNAMAMATGFYLGSGNAAVVYMQNSGLGNVVNPMTSLCDRQVYSIPMLLVIGWRGEPNVKDEPQHVKQGAITLQQLELLDVPHLVVDSTSTFDSIALLLKQMYEESRPVALVVKKDTFASVTSSPGLQSFSMKRESALSCLLDCMHPDTVVVSTTGKTSREVFELRKAKNQPTRDFLTVGGMGHTASISLGVAMAQPKRLVVALDGDGSMLMHMGALAVTGAVAPSNFIHVVLNNQSHESVGGQPTVITSVDIKGLAKACGYKDYLCFSSEKEIQNYFTRCTESEGPVLVEIQIAQGARAELGRPTSTPIENKQAFMQHLGSTQKAQEHLK
ncbi:phosphonopyruvate decarboxylase [Alteromonas ponticola]|uniref:Phosphonopyruvate decarboxylase n=1 Tax=Alteromonas ponticola TaxID=2720613 RepID=A0ABX1R3I6_9ALTE|nr:phosphonopyruvate decarboxylase [Alteromonas ponticola]NMH59647.1 phosphonopyruvate decarboxylase [Alteromonas ponticola]